MQVIRISGPIQFHKLIVSALIGSNVVGEKGYFTTLVPPAPVLMTGQFCHHVDQRLILNRRLAIVRRRRTAMP